MIITHLFLDNDVVDNLYNKNIIQLNNINRVLNGTNLYKHSYKKTFFTIYFTSVNPKEERSCVSSITLQSMIFLIFSSQI